jgi:hypothetical protein
MSPEEAKRVALAFGRRPAWLLFGELPETLGSSRSLAELADDLSVEICRRLSIRFGGSTIVADGNDLLDRLESDETAALEAWDAWRKRLAEVPSILRVAAANASYPEMGEWLRKHAELLDDDQTPTLPATRPPIARYRLSGVVMVYPGRNK